MFVQKDFSVKLGLNKQRLDLCPKTHVPAITRAPPQEPDFFIYSKPLKGIERVQYPRQLLPPSDLGWGAAPDKGGDH